MNNLPHGSGIAGYPHVRLAGGRAEAVVYLPEPSQGYYRGPRFDWSGLVASLRLDGHEIFGAWKTAPHDPLGNDFAVGPAGEFGMGPDTSNPPPLGYDEAAPGGRFLKIGVGELRKPDDRPYQFGAAYEIVRPAPWSSRWGGSWIEFAQQAVAAPGWGYRYVKRIELPAGEPAAAVTYRLENTGSLPIRQSWYCHNFIRIDERPIGTDYRLELPWAPRPVGTFGDAVEVRGTAVAFVRDLRADEGMFAAFEGFGPSAADNAVTVRGPTAAVRIRGSLPVARFHLFATGRTVCPEMFVGLDLSPGSCASWTDRYSLVD